MHKEATLKERSANVNLVFFLTSCGGQDFLNTSCTCVLTKSGVKVQSCEKVFILGKWDVGAHMFENTVYKEKIEFSQL